MTAPGCTMVSGVRHRTAGNDGGGGRPDIRRGEQAEVKGGCARNGDAGGTAKGSTCDEGQGAAVAMTTARSRCDAAVERTRPGREVLLESKVPAPEMTPQMVCDWLLPKAKVAPLLMAMLAA